MMIVYNPKKWHGFIVLAMLRGSPFPGAAVWGFLSASVAAAVKYGAAGKACYACDSLCLRASAPPRC